MTKKEKKYVVPASKPRNPLIAHPLLKKGGAMEATEKTKRAQEKQRLAKIKLNGNFSNNDDYGPGM